MPPRKIPPRKKPEKYAWDIELSPGDWIDIATKKSKWVELQGTVSIGVSYHPEDPTNRCWTFVQYENGKVLSEGASFYPGQISLTHPILKSVMCT